MFYCLHHNQLNETSAAFRIEGPDANTYVQGQFTQDIVQREVTSNYGLFLNQKGKVLADAWVLRRGTNEFSLVSFSAGAARLRERLEAYLIADEVTITDETELWARISVWGDGVAEVVAKLLGQQAPAAGTWLEAKSMKVFRGRLSAAENFELLVSREMAAKLVGELRVFGASEADGATAERERINSGLPAVPTDIGLNDLPNEGGLDEVAISYTKGCYLGQEVMARLKNLGQVRRRLHIVRGPGEPAAPGVMLFQGDKKVGEVRSVAREGDGFVAMAMLSLVNFDAAVGLNLTPNGPVTLSLIRRV
jgi:tRNA-modifying protein YgfZ